MKVIITGATGYVGTEVVRQALTQPAITSVIALSRKPISLPEAETIDKEEVAKLQNVLIEDYGVYSEDVRKAFAGADACIWTVAITPTKSKDYTPEEVKRICHDHTMIGIQAMYESLGDTSTTKISPHPSFRFMYVSGVATERDQSKLPEYKPEFFPEYRMMRGETENQLLSFAAEHSPRVEVCVTKPGAIITKGDQEKLEKAKLWEQKEGVPWIYKEDLAAAMLNQCLNGFEKEPLMNEDLVRIGKQVLG